MADKDFVVKNGLVVNTSFAANSTQFTLSTINATSNGFFANTTQIKIGNSSVNATINSTAFTGDAATVGSNTASTLRTYSDTVGSTAYSNAMSNTLSRNGSYTGNNTFGGTNTVISSNLNVTGTFINVASAFIANSTGAYHTGIVNAANFTTTGTVNTATVYATGLVNAVSYNTGGGYGSATGGSIVNTTIIAVGNSTVNVSTNSTVFSGTSNNSTYLNGQLASYYTSATNLNAGTVASARISGSYTGITGVGTITAGTWQGSSISTTYTDAKVSSVSGSSGLTGTVTSSGSISVLANNGITANSSGTFVTQGTGTVVNATGVHVNSTYIGTIASYSATYASSSATNTFTVGTASYFVANGNFGIGTSSPSALLDVFGTIRTGSGGTDPGTGAAFYFVGSGSYQTVVAGAEFAVHTGGNNARTERLRIDSSGNVGISNNAPSHKLSVNGTVYAGGKITSGVGAASDGLDLSTNDAWANMRVIRNNGGLYNDGMYIGYGNANSALTRIYGGGATSGSLDKYSTYSQEAGSFRAPIFYDSDNTSYYIDAASTSVLSNLNILSNCRVNDLQWYGSSGGSDQKYWDTYPVNDTGNSLNFRAVNDAYSSAYSWLTVTRSGYQPQDITFYTGTGSSRMIIAANGNIGIGTTTPNEKLVANGYISSDGTVCRNGVTNSPAPSVFNAFNISFDGTYAHMWIDNTDLGILGTSSDYRIKKNVQTQTLSALDRIANIRPVTYQFAKNDHFTMIKDDDTIREGFIAHELAEIIPSAVTGEKDEPNKIQSLKLDALCSVLVKAIQELKAEFDDYKATHP